MKVQVIRKPLKHDRKLYAIGDTLEMPRRVAHVFQQLKRVMPAAEVDSDMSFPAAPAAPIAVVTGEFDHPGLDVEDASDLLGEPANEPAKPKRTYKRRDLKAE